MHYNYSKISSSIEKKMEEDSNTHQIDVQMQQRKARHYLFKMRSQRNTIWTFFVPSNDCDHALCQECREEVPCLKGSTTSLRAHLKNRHPDLFDDMIKVNLTTKGLISSASHVTFVHEDQLLQQEIREIWESKLYSDLNIICQDDNGIVRTHQIIIASLSTYLRNLMSNADNSSDVMTIVLPDVKSSTLEEFLSNVFFATDGDAKIDPSLEHLGFGSSAEVNESLFDFIETTYELQVTEDSFEFDEINISTNLEQIGGDESAFLKRKRAQVLESRKNRSPTWDFFIKTDSSSATCKTCKVMIKTETGNTSGMAAHLRIVHPALYEAMKRIKVPKDLDEEKNEDFEINDDLSYISDQADDTDKRKRRKRSLIWKYFKQIENTTSLCLSCKATIKTETGNTTGMINHLKGSHHESFLEFWNARCDSGTNNCKTVDTVPKPEIEEVNEMDVQPDSDEDHSEKRLSEEAWKSSPVWQFFDCCGNGQVQCIDCNEVLKKVPFSTANMIYHIKNSHPDVYKSSIQDKLQNPDLPDTGDTSHPIWMYFELTAIEDQEGESFAKCRACNVILPFPDSVSKLEAHVEQNHDTIRIEYARLCGLWKLQRLEEADVAFKVVKRRQNTRSAVWKYFSHTKERTKNICKTCNKLIVCNQQNTTNMIRHLECNHQDLYSEFLKDTMTPGEGTVEGENKIQRRRRGPKPLLKNDPLSRTCPECQKMFSCRPAMLYHRKTVHSGVRPYKCNDCGMTFSRPDSFRGHTHNKVRSYLCSLCGKTFARKNIRDQHERAHRGDKRYSCSFCSKPFMTNQQKANHERTHTGEKPFQCTECGRQFAQQHQLTTHMRIHTGEKPYNCPRCDQKFRHLSSRNNHKCDTKLSAGARWSEDEPQIVEEDHDLLDS